MTQKPSLPNPEPPEPNWHTDYARRLTEALQQRLGLNRLDAQSIASVAVTTIRPYPKP